MYFISLRKGGDAVKCEVCTQYEATVKDYRDDGEKYRSCKWCANLSNKNWYMMMFHHKHEDRKIDPKTFYEEEDEDDT